MSVSQLTKKNEGLRLKPYRCTGGKLTIGYGRNLDDRGITKAEAEYLFSNDLKRVRQELEDHLGWYKEHPVGIQVVMEDMCFNLGITKFLKFKRTIQLIREKKYYSAANNLTKTLWHKQVGRRAVELENMLESEGKWQAEDYFHYYVETTRQA